MSGVFQVIEGKLRVGKLSLAEWEVSTNAQAVGNVPELYLSVDNEAQATIDVPEKVNESITSPI